MTQRLLVALVLTPLLLLGSVCSFTVPQPTYSSRVALLTRTNLRRTASHPPCDSFFSISSRVSNSRITRPTALSAEASSEEDDSAPQKKEKSENEEKDATKWTTRFKKSIGRYFRSSDKDDGLTTKQRLAKMGLATVLSYGWISNTNAMILLSAAWYVFCVRVS